MATRTVSAGQSLQSAYDQSQYGDVLSLEAGATFGQLRVTPKSGSGKITIQSSRLSEIPQDKLVNPSQSGLMPKFLGPNPEPAIMIEDGAHDVEFLGIEAKPANEFGADVYDIVAGGLNSSTLDAIPKRFLFDRCYIHGLPKLHTKNGLNTNFADVTIKNTNVSEIHGLGQESHAVAWFNTPGPIKIHNSYLEAAGIGILSGGAQPRITGLVPSDIEIVDNYLPKKLSWMIGHSEYAGIPWNVKNSLELKSARRVRIEGNKAEYSWKMGQIGMGLNLNASTEDSGAWNVIEDVLVKRNQFLKCANGAVIAGGNKLASDSTEVKLKRVTLEDNLIECGFWGGEGKAMQLGQGSEDLTLDHNTLLISDAVLPNGMCVFMSLDGSPGLFHTRLKVLSNLGSHGFYGVFGNGGYMAKAALDKYARDWQFQKNAMFGDMSQGRAPDQYPPDNYFMKTLAEAQPLLGVDGQPVGVRGISLPPPTQPPPTQPPTQPPGTPSPDGTKATEIVDSQGTKWTLGPEKQTLRNGTHVGGGSGFIYKYVSLVVYVLGMDQKTWFKWDGSTWIDAGTTEPGGSATEPKPTPPREPVIGAINPNVPWDVSEAQDNAEAKKQRAQGWYFYEHQTGKKARFIYTGVKL